MLRLEMVPFIQGISGIPPVGALARRKPRRCPCEALLPASQGWACSPCMATDQLFLRSSYNEFYFLTHPALFIEDHFPDNKNWQLLKPPQSLRQFENNMYHKSEFYNKGMLSAHPETPVVRTGNPGPAACRDGAACSVHLGVWAHMGLPCQSPSQGP